MVSEPGSSELGSYLPQAQAHSHAISKLMKKLLSSRLFKPFKLETFSSMACPEAILSSSSSLMCVLKKEGQWKLVQAILIFCPKKILSRWKLSTQILVWRLKHEERWCLWHHGVKRRSRKEGNEKKGGVFGMMGSREGHTKKGRLVSKPTLQTCPFMKRLTMEIQGTSSGSLTVRQLPSLSIKLETFDMAVCCDVCSCPEGLKA